MSALLYYTPEGELPLKRLERCGVYMIRHVPSGNRYVGSSYNISGRWRKHRGLLRRGVHHNSNLQADWNSHKSDEFSFSVLAFCSTSVQFENERTFIKTLNPEYNARVTQKKISSLQAHASYKNKLSVLEKNSILMEQGNTCAICKCPDRGTLILDHRHVIGTPASFICITCSTCLRRIESSILHLKVTAEMLIYLGKQMGGGSQRQWSSIDALTINGKPPKEKTNRPISRDGMCLTCGREVRPAGLPYCSKECVPTYKDKPPKL